MDQYRRPWAPPTALLSLFALLGAFLFLKQPAIPEDEPRSRTTEVWPIDPEITASLEQFLEATGPAGSTAGEGLAARAGRSWDGSFRRGIALGLHSKDLRYDYLELLREIRDYDAGWVSLFFNMFQENGTSVAMNPPTRLKDQEEIIARAARHAHSLGLKVICFPVVLLSDPAGDEWRGNIKPKDMGRWFKNYGAHIERLARLSEAEGIEALSVGSEFSSLEKEADRWRDLIGNVREIYSGEVIYSSNWDHYRYVPFWEEVDAIGLSGYYELTRSREPALGELVEAWTEVRDEILEWRDNEARLDEPIIFTEIGYANIDGTNIYPWDYTMKADPDPAEQALCYEAFIRVWDGQEALRGAFFYNWFGIDSIEDTGYSPRGKPAAHLLKTWYSHLALGPDDN